MPSSLRWPDAALAGLASSMRSMSGPATLAARGRIGGRTRTALLAAGLGELVVDKTSVAVDRWKAPALAGRLGAGAYTGLDIAGPAGAAVATISAAVGSYSTWRIRRLVGDATGLSDPIIAAAEDVVAYALVAAATAEHPTDAELAHVEADVEIEVERVADSSVAANAVKGLIAGLAGTATMTIAQGAEFVLTDAEPSDAPATVADRASRALGLGRIRRRDRAAANQGMHWLYGTAWGIPFGIVAASAKARPELTGPAFGLFVWAVGLGQQPALGVAEVPWKRSPASLGSEAFFHVVYGIGAGAALRVLRNR